MQPIVIQVRPKLHVRRILLVSVALVLVALGLGVSIGYGFAPTRTSSVTRFQTLLTTSTETVPTTVTVIYSSGHIYTLLTVTEQTVLVIIYVPKCVTVSGTTSITYTSPPFGQSTTITYTYPATITNSSAVSFTTVTNRTLTASNQTQTESISC